MVLLKIVLKIQKLRIWYLVSLSCKIQTLVLLFLTEILDISLFNFYIYKIKLIIIEPVS